MANQQTIWERVYRTGYDALNPNALLQGLNDRLVQVQTALNLKANIASPALTGTPTVPDYPTPDTAFSAQALNVSAHTAIHAGGRFNGTAPPITYGPVVWSIMSHTGTADQLRGGVALGPGSQGLSLPQGLWVIGASAYVDTIGVGARRHLVALADGDGVGIFPQVVVNSSALVSPDLHINATWVLAVGAAGMHARLSMYSDGGTYRTHAYSLTAARLGPST